MRSVGKQFGKQRVLNAQLGTENPRVRLAAGKSEKETAVELPLDIRLLLEQADSMMNLLSNLMYRYLALGIASLGLIFALNKLDNLLITLYIAFILTLFIIRLPMAILAEVYAYNKLRYNLITKFLDGKDITEEKSLIKIQIETELNKFTSSALNFDPLYIYLFFIFGGAIILLAGLNIIDWAIAILYTVLLLVSILLIHWKTKSSFDFLKKVEKI